MSMSAIFPSNGNTQTIVERNCALFYTSFHWRRNEDLAGSVCFQQKSDKPVTWLLNWNLGQLDSSVGGQGWRWDF